MFCHLMPQPVLGCQLVGRAAGDADVESGVVDRDFLVCGEPGVFGGAADVVLLPAVVVAHAEMDRVRRESPAEAGRVVAGDQERTMVTFL